MLGVSLFLVLWMSVAVAAAIAPSLLRTRPRSLSEKGRSLVTRGVSFSRRNTTDAHSERCATRLRRCWFSAYSDVPAFLLLGPSPERCLVFFYSKVREVFALSARRTTPQVPPCHMPQRLDPKILVFARRSIAQVLVLRLSSLS